MLQNVRDFGAVVIALILVVTFCALVLLDVLNNRPVVIPDAMLVLVSGVVAFFFGQHATSNGATSSRLTAAATASQIATQTNAAKPPTPGT